MQAIGQKIQAIHQKTQAMDQKEKQVINTRNISHRQKSKSLPIRLKCDNFVRRIYIHRKLFVAHLKKIISCIACISCRK